MNSPSWVEWPSLPASASTLPTPINGTHHGQFAAKGAPASSFNITQQGPSASGGRPMVAGHNGRTTFTHWPHQQAFQVSAAPWNNLAQQQQQQHRHQQQQHSGPWALAPPPMPVANRPYSQNGHEYPRNGAAPPGLGSIRPGARPSFSMAKPQPFEVGRAHNASSTPVNHRPMPPPPPGLVPRKVIAQNVHTSLPHPNADESQVNAHEIGVATDRFNGSTYPQHSPQAVQSAPTSSSGAQRDSSSISPSSLQNKSPALDTTSSSPGTTLRESSILGGSHVPNEEQQLLSPTFDRYAPIYTPTWLQGVNEDRMFTLHPLPERLPIDFETYASKFLPPSLYWSEADEDEGMMVSDEDEATTDVSSLERADSSWLAPVKEENAAAKVLEGELEPVNENEDDDNDLTADKGEANASVGAISQAQTAANGTEGAMYKPPGDLPLALQASAAHASPSEPIPPLEPATYAERFDLLERFEVEHRGRELDKQSLFSVKLRAFHPQSKSEQSESSPWSASHLYALDLPGVREDYPALMPGDLIQLRTLASHSDSWLKLAFEARVHIVRKIEGTVILRCDALSRELRSLFTSIDQVRFNVLFVGLQRNTTEVVQDVARLGKLLKRKSRPAQILKRWLFPASRHLEVEAEGQAGARKRHELEWVDGSLNAEQKGAVLDIAFRSHRIPYLVAGPPGTGKTKTLVEATLQIVRNDPDAAILLAAPSNTAADTLALRLAGHFGPSEVVRLNDPARTFAEVPERLLLFCCIEDQKEGEEDGAAAFGLPSWKKLMAMRVVVMATHDIPLLHRTRGASNIDLGRLHNGVASVFKQNGVMPRLKNHWTHLIIDEAGQATEADLSSALLCVVPSPFTDKSLPAPTVVLCGDCNQLGAHIQSNAARNGGLDISLLERLSERSVYRDELKRLRKQGREALMAGNFGPGVDGILRNTSDDRRTATAAHLVRNYRARNAALLHVVSNLFYDDALLPCGPLSTLPTSSWSLLPNKNCPLLFDNVEGNDAWVDEGASFYNDMEIARVVELIESLTGRSPSPDALAPTSNGNQKEKGIVNAKDIAVITPYREQVWRIRLALRKRGLAAVNVGHVEVFQGAEHLVTILSTVRTSARFLRVDAARSMGLLFERKRLCVAISRAKELLIVVGNATLLMRDPYWRSLLEHAVRTSTFRGQLPDKLAKASSPNEVNEGGQISALEYAARTNEMSSIATSDTALLAGRMAASTLLEDD